VSGRALARSRARMGVDVHDAAEGDVVAFAGATAGELTLGTVVASAGCTIWAQPLGASAAREDDEWLELRCDTTREPAHLQGEIECVLPTVADADGGVRRCRRSELPAGVRVPPPDAGRSLHGSDAERQQAYY